MILAFVNVAISYFFPLVLRIQGRTLSLRRMDLWSILFWQGLLVRVMHPVWTPPLDPGLIASGCLAGWAILDLLLKLWEGNQQAMSAGNRHTDSAAASPNTEKCERKTKLRGCFGRRQSTWISLHYYWWSDMPCETVIVNCLSLFYSLSCVFVILIKILKWKFLTGWLCFHIAYI